jgi:DNA-binding NarL/FixJ family response regulator
MRRVLVVDDSGEVRRTVRALLEAALGDLAIGEAAAAAEALALVERQPWDAVLLDLSLPDRRGMDALRDLVRLRPRLPVLVMSLHPEAAYGPAVRAAGAAGYVAKGSAPEAIVAAVAAVLPAPLGASPESSGVR